MENHNWNWRVILEPSCWRLTLLEAHLAGGYLCPKLLTFEPKVVKRFILELKGQSREVEGHPAKLSLEQ